MQRFKIIGKPLLGEKYVEGKKEEKERKKEEEYRVRQRGCSLTHSAPTPPAVHPGITIWVNEIELERIMLSLVATTCALARKPCVSTNYVRTNLYIYIVTDEGLHHLDLMHFFFRPTGGNTRLMRRGKFSGLAILGRDSDFPIVLTATRTSTCSFLEMRGD